MTAEDRALVFEKLVTLVPHSTDTSRFVAFEHRGTPMPKERARTLKGFSFTPPDTVAAERDLGFIFRTFVRERPMTTNVAVVGIFYVPDARTRDIDNLLKLVMDSATGAGVWSNDNQVTAVASFLELDAQRPRTLVGLAPTTSTLDRTVPMKKRRASLPLGG